MAEADIDALQLNYLIPDAKKIAQGDGRTWTTPPPDSTPVPDAYVIAWYKAYLHCRYQHDNDANKKEKFVAISRMADDLWHAHILKTVQYTNDMKKIFGHYLHHTPQDNVDQDTPQFLDDKGEYENECQAAIANLAGPTGPARTTRMAPTAAPAAPAVPGIPPDIVHICS